MDGGCRTLFVVEASNLSHTDYSQKVVFYKCQVSSEHPGILALDSYSDVCTYTRHFAPDMEARPHIN